MNNISLHHTFVLDETIIALLVIDVLTRQWQCCQIPNIFSVYLLIILLVSFFNFFFRFSTAFRRHASVDDIYQAGLITEEQLEGLQCGTITEEDLSSQLRQYLFGGEEPIAGVILESTGKKSSLNEN